MQKERKKVIHMCVTLTFMKSRSIERSKDKIIKKKFVKKEGKGRIVYKQEFSIFELVKRHHHATEKTEREGESVVSL